MTAEESACNGAGEARKAELAEKEAVEAPAEGKGAEERESEEGVGGPFVIVDGESDDLSEKNSDLANKPDPAVPEEKGEAPESNAPPDAAASGDRGAASGEADVLDPARNALPANGHDHPAAEPEVRVDESKDEQTASGVTELGEQKVTGGVQDDCVAELSVQEATGGVQDDPVAELLVQEATCGAQDEAGVSTAGGHEHGDTNADTCASAVESEVTADENKGGQVSANCTELVDQKAAGGEHDGADVLMANGHDHADTSADSGAIAAESEVHSDESKWEQGAAGSTELVEQEATGGGQDEADVWMANGHDHAHISADSCAHVVESEVPVDERKGEQSTDDVAELGEGGRVSEIDDEGLEKVVNAAISKESREVEILANGHGHAEEITGADVELEPEPVVEEGDDEAVPAVPELEERIGKEIVQDGDALVTADPAEESEPLMEEREDDAVPTVAELEERVEKTNEDILEERVEKTSGEILEQRVEKTSEEILQDDELAKDEGDAVSLQPLETESDLGGDKKVEVEIAAVVESTADSAAEVNNNVEQKTTDCAQTQELATVVEDDSTLLHVNSSGEVEEKEVMKLACLEETNLASVEQQITDPHLKVHEQLEIRGNSLADKGENGILELEPKQQAEMEVRNGAPLQTSGTAAVSSFSMEPRSLDLVDSDGVEHSSPSPKLETCGHAQTEALTEDKGSQEKSSTAVAQVEPTAYKEHGPVAVDDAELSSAARDESVVVDEAEAISNKEDRSNDLGADNKSIEHISDPYSENLADANTLEDQLDVCNISSPCETVPSGTRNIDSCQTNEPASPIEERHDSDGALEPRSESSHAVDETCSSEGTCKEVCSENVKAFTKSSEEVETKCVEAVESISANMIVGAERKDDEEHVHDEAKIIEGSSEYRVEIDIDKSNNKDIQVVRQQRIYIIKVPRFAGEDLWAKIQDAQIHLDQLTQERDATNVLKQKQKAVCDEYREKLEAARQEERGARAAHGDKRQDLNNVQSMIGKLSKANSIEEIDEMIAMKNKIIQHETIPLKEEKLLIQEIKELKAQRKQLYSNMGSKSELNEAFHQKEHIHERHKTLKKDSDVLFNNLKSLEEKTKAIQKDYDSARTKLRTLNDDYRVANEKRQKAYDKWFELKTEPGKKNKDFFMYKRDRNIASEYVSLGDMKGLQLYCNSQVERIMEIWNKDDDFRRQYVEANKISTLRRLETLDGRRLGPNEVPPVIPSNFNRRPSNPSSLPASSPHMPPVVSEASPGKSAPVVASVQEESFPVLHAPQISKCAKSKASGSSPQKETTTAPVPEREDLELIEKEKIRMEELDLARKAEELARREEELRKEKAAAEKERLKLEQKEKAKEAEERKKRKAEKAQERAEYKARKEAEMKEKKKAKKDKKKGTSSAESASGSGESNTLTTTTTDGDSSTSENTRGADVPQHTAPKRLSRPAVAVKQLNRVQPIPLPLRNRGKRKMRQYILVALAVLSVIALFVAGNYVSFPSLRQLRF